MKRFTLTAILLIVICGYPLRAQDERQRFEIFGAYSMVRFNTFMAQPAREDFTPPLTTSESYPLPPDPSYLGWQNMHGWNGSFTVNLTRRLALVADFAGQYSPGTHQTVSTYADNPSIAAVAASSSHHSLLAGPRFYFRNSTRFTPFVHGLVGVSRITQSISGEWPAWGPGGPGQYLAQDSHRSTTGLAGAGGVGLDVRVSRHMSLRLAQVDYLMARREDEGKITFTDLSSGQTKALSYRIPRYLQKNLRLSYGVVFTF